MSGWEWEWWPPCPQRSSWAAGVGVGGPRGGGGPPTSKTNTPGVQAQVALVSGVEQLVPNLQQRINDLEMGSS